MLCVVSELVQCKDWTMTILYAVIARGPTVLCSHQIGTGNYEMVMLNVLPNIPTSQDAKTSYTSSNKYALQYCQISVTFFSKFLHTFC